MLKKILAIAIALAGFTTHHATATNIDAEFANFLQTVIAHRQGVSFEENSLVLREIHGLSDPITFAIVAAVFGWAAAHFFNKAPDNRMKNSARYGYFSAGFSLFMAYASYEAYSKYSNPPTLYTFTQNGLKIKSGRVIPWAKIHNHKILISRIVNQYHTTIGELSTLLLYDRSRAKLLELEMAASNMPITPEELDMLIKTYRNSFSSNPQSNHA